MVVRNCDLEAVALVWTDNWEAEQVGCTDKEVSMDGVEGEPV